MKRLIERFRKSTFQRQLGLTLTVGVLAIALLSSLASSWQGSRQIRGTLREQGESIASSLAIQAEQALLRHAGDSAAEAVDVALSFPDVIQVELWQPDGRVVMRRTKAGESPVSYGRAVLPATAKPYLEAETGDAWRFIAPVFTRVNGTSASSEEAQKQLLGYVRIVQSKASMERTMANVFVVNFSSSFFLAFLFLAAIRVLTRRLMQPLSHLSGSMARAECGEINVRADVDGPRDIADMAHVFNSMISVLEEREQELLRARDEAMHFGRLKAEFAATVSHEVRTPLNGVIGTLDILMATRLPPEPRRYVELAWESAQYLLDLVNNILDFSKLEAGKLELDRTEFGIVQLIEDVVELTTSSANQKGLDLGYLVAPSMPRKLWGDPRCLQQVLVNLVGNAIKFTESGEVAMRVTAESVSREQWCLRFEVSDSGIGIEPEVQRAIFDSFSQADPSTTRRYGGSGLGLAICKQLVALMGGEIGVDSVPGKGSRFWFTVTLESAMVGGVLTMPQEPIGAGQAVLVVDESDIVRRFLEQSLRSWGFVCRTLSSADEAIDVLLDQQGVPFGTVLMDARFTAAAGGELPAAIRRAPISLQPRLIGMGRPAHERQASTAGLDGWLAKPLRIERLLTCLSDWRHAGEGVSLASHGEHLDPAVEDCQILVVEDNRTNQTVVQGMLSMLGYQVQLAGDGREAVHAFHRQSWDLILMDCNMPEMDGYEAAAAIRKLEQGSNTRVPIIAMTANVQPSDIDRCLDAGMDDHLPKPLTLGNVRAKIARWRTVRPAKAAAAVDAPQTPQPSDGPLELAVLAKLREALGDTLDQAIQPFLEDMPGYLTTLEEALKEGAAERIWRTAHSIKGAGSTLGANGLALLAKDIESLAHAGDLSSMDMLLQRLRDEYAGVEPILQAELRPDPATPWRVADEGALVLVVDDDRSTRQALSHALKRGGFQVEEAADGAQALAAIERILPDVVLMDAVMPVMDGFTACSLLQTHPRGQGIPVLMITALEDAESIERAFAVGASDYIPKPIHLSVVHQRVKRIVEATRAERHVRHLAFNDALTGLPNRVQFTEQLDRAIARAEAAGQGLAVLFLDLDRFKFVNDTLGHEIGDRLLKSVAQRIKLCVRQDDCVARLGGDEFTVLLDELPNQTVAASAAQKIGRALSEPFEIEGHDIFISTSVGISIYPADGGDVSTLLRHADTAMYKAKKGNRGFQFFERGMDTSVSEHLRMESALRRALERDELMVYYQPEAETASGRIIGMEALVRWMHPTRGLVSPAEFIPLAEETGLIIGIGEWVLRTACEQAKAWLAAGMSDLRMAVNLSGKQLQREGFVDMVVQILVETGLDPKHLTLEITESVLMEHARDTVSTLYRLKNIGLNLAIDDFGTGYSSLAYLKRFPVDMLKIDYSFTRDVTSNPDDAAIVTGIVALAHSLRLTVVAEGVETAAQRDFLAGLGCDMIQGYYLSEPLPAALFEQRVMEERALEEVGELPV